jgi:polyphenol oxidase
MIVGAPPLQGTVEDVPGFRAAGVIAFTTTREQGSFALQSGETASTVFGRWGALADQLRPHSNRLAFAHQVHGDSVLRHRDGWSGWLRASEGDGHFASAPGTAMAVTVADCVPVFIAHPKGATAAVHSGWKGTERQIVTRALMMFREDGFPPAELLVHCGPAICGVCYEVSPDVYGRLTGASVDRPTPVDLRAIIAAQASSHGVRDVTISPWCTRCHNDRFFSHRCGDEGRQLGVIVAASRSGIAVLDQLTR